MPVKMNFMFVGYAGCTFLLAMSLLLGKSDERVSRADYSNNENTEIRHVRKEQYLASRGFDATLIRGKRNDLHSRLARIFSVVSLLVKSRQGPLILAHCDAHAHFVQLLRTARGRANNYVRKNVCARRVHERRDVHVANSAGFQRFHPLKSSGKNT